VSQKEDGTIGKMQMYNWLLDVSSTFGGSQPPI
jgi:hypothetical protein